MFKSVDAHRKKQREKEIRKSKQKKEIARISQYLSKSTTDELKKQLQDILNLEKSGKQLDAVTKSKKNILLEIINSRSDETTSSRKTSSSSSTTPNNDLSALYPYPKMSIYYHPIRNPYGAPPPGMPMIYIKGFDPNDEYNYLLDFDVDDIPPPPSDEDDDKNIPLPPDESQLPLPFMNVPPPHPPGVPPPPPFMNPPPGFPPPNFTHPPPPIPPYGYVPPPPGIKKQAPPPPIPPTKTHTRPPQSHFKLPPQKIQKTSEKTNVQTKTDESVSEKEVEEVTQFIPTSVLMRKLKK